MSAHVRSFIQRLTNVDVSTYIKMYDVVITLFVCLDTGYILYFHMLNITFFK